MKSEVAYFDAWCVHNATKKHKAIIIKYSLGKRVWHLAFRDLSSSDMKLSSNFFVPKIFHRHFALNDIQY